MTTLSYDIAQDTANGFLIESRLHAAMEADPIAAPIFSGVGRSGNVLSVEVTTAPDPDQRAAVDAVVAAHTAGQLGIDKIARRAGVDRKTVELIQGGFAYGGKVFSLSAEAQSFWNSLGSLLANNSLVEPDDFPIDVSTRNDLDDYLIPSIADAVLITAAAQKAVQRHLSQGSQLKVSIRAAANQTALNGVVDNR